VVPLLYSTLVRYHRPAGKNSNAGYDVSLNSEFEQSYGDLEDK
jgi:hypothetical protein